MSSTPHELRAHLELIAKASASLSTATSMVVSSARAIADATTAAFMVMDQAPEIVRAARGQAFRLALARHHIPLTSISYRTRIRLSRLEELMNGVEAPTPEELTILRGVFGDDFLGDD